MMETRKRLEWESLWHESKSTLIDLARRYKLAANTKKSKTVNKWIDIATAIFLKGMPNKIESDDLKEFLQVVLIRRDGEEIASKPERLLPLN